MYTLIYLVVVGCLVESITQICIKSIITEPIRVYIIAKYPTSKLTYFITCGYCFSFWISLGLLSLSYCVSSPPSLVSNAYINFIIILLLIHRLSNIVHGAVDKYFDKRYDIRYNRVN